MPCIFLETPNHKMQIKTIFLRYTDTKKLREQNSILNVRKRQHEGTATNGSNNSIQEITESNYKNFPVPQVVMVVKYRPKEGCF